MRFSERLLLAFTCMTVATYICEVTPGYRYGVSALVICALAMRVVWIADKGTQP